MKTRMARSVPNALRQIIDHKLEEIRLIKQAQPLEALREMISERGIPRNFFAAVTRSEKATRPAIIAEVKRKSPSAGWIRPEFADDNGFDPVSIARQYHEAGARAISCLTDERFFGGKLEYIDRIRDAVPIPVLRKDFIIDPYQVWESRAAGADAILLIAECLREAELLDLMILAHELKLTVLLEVHSSDNLFRVLPHVGFPKPSYTLLGINNRNLETMTTDVAHTLRLVDMIEDTSVLVSESGISEPEHLKKLHKAGVHIALVGESLMRTDSPGQALRELLA